MQKIHVIFNDSVRTMKDEWAALKFKKNANSYSEFSFLMNDF